MRIIDTFIFNDEINMLKFRLKELYDYVDNFVLVEASRTHKGDPKPLYFQENQHLFTEYLDKITHIIVNDMPEGEDPWVRENFQRNAIDRGIEELNLHDEDIIVISDCDEIINRNLLVKLSENKFKGIARLRQDLFYYNLYTLVDLNWDYAMVLDFSTYKSFGRKPHSIRYSYPPVSINSAGWHFSFFGGTEQIIKKIKTYAHQEFNTNSITDPTIVEENVTNQKDVLLRNDMNFIKKNPHAESNMPVNYKMLLEEDS
jgi:beta-1,4-mannosyl-glycoprotein beta-1,4-N-acetylglucosaminyltransferase